MARDSPRIFDRRDRSLSRFHASAALACNPDRHFWVQAGRSNGGRDVDSTLYLAGIFAPGDRHGLESFRILLYCHGGSLGGRGDDQIRHPPLADSLWYFAVAREPVLCSAGGWWA